MNTKSKNTEDAKTFGEHQNASLWGLSFQNGHFLLQRSLPLKGVKQNDEDGSEQF